MNRLISWVLVCAGLFALQSRAQTTQSTWSINFATYLGAPGDLSGGPSAANSAGDVCAIVGTSLTALSPSGVTVYTVKVPFAAYDSIAVDSTGSCYVAGRDISTTPTVVPTPGAFQGVRKGGQFAMKFSPAGAVVYATYLNGSGPDISKAAAVDANGNLFLAGQTQSPDFPVKNAYQSAGGGRSDGFIAVLNAAGTDLVYSTYLGGLQDDSIESIAVDSSGNCYVTGSTQSSNFPVTGNPAPFQSSLQATSDAFVAKLNPSGVPVYSTYLSGSGGSQGWGIAADNSGDAYVAGNALSADFPLVNAVQSSWNKSLFVTEINPAGTSLVYSTFLGTNSFALSRVPVATDSAGAAYVAGQLSQSTTVPTVAPILNSPPDNSGFVQGRAGGFLTIIAPSGSSFSFSSYLWGEPETVAVDSLSNIYVAGVGNPMAIVNASNGTFVPSSCQFPTLNCIPFIPTQPFALKLAPAAGPVLALPNEVAFLPTEVLTPSLPATIHLANASNSGTIGILSISANGDFSQTNNCPAQLPPATECVITTVFTPTAAGIRTGTLTVTHDQSANPRTVKLDGTGLSPAESITPMSLTFAPQDINVSSSAQSITLANTDGVTQLTAALSVVISSISISGSDFSQTNNCTSPLPSQSSCTIHVAFTPTAGGSRTGTLTIADNGASSPHIIALSGTGVAPTDFAITPAVGTPASQVVAAGQSAHFNLVVVPGASASGTLNLGCTVAPVVTAGPGCSLPTSLNMVSGSALTVPITLTTTSSNGTSASIRTHPTNPFASLFITALFVPGLIFVHRRFTRCAFMLAIALVLVGCGGGGTSSTSTQSPHATGTYTVTITATSGSTSHNAVLTLIVQ